MANLISGSIAVLLMIWFVGGLAVSIGSVPFFIIAVAVLGMTVADLVESVINSRNNTGG